MPEVTDIEADTELSESDAEDLSGDIRRCLRRARYDIRQRDTIKESRQFAQTAAENLRDFLKTLMPEIDNATFEDCWKKIQEHNKEAIQAAKPFISYFYSHGLLPDSITENALIVYVIIQGKKLGIFHFE